MIHQNLSYGLKRCLEQPPQNYAQMLKMLQLGIKSFPFSNKRTLNNVQFKDGAYYC